MPTLRMPSPYCTECDHSAEASAPTCANCGADRPVEGWPIDPLIGKQLAGTYTVIRRLGSGGFGVVYLAEHDELGGKRAIKVLHNRYVHKDAVLRRFKREAKALYRLQSPFTIRMEQWGRSKDGHYYLVMELAEGETLRQVLDQGGPLPERRALDVTRQIAVALADAHALGIVHRDLKPDNIVVRRHRHEGERIAVLDFGISKILSDETSNHRSGLVGTPAYMAPEIWRPELGEVNIRADLWSLGLIAFEMLTGDLPFHTGNTSEPVGIAMQACNLSPATVNGHLARAEVSASTREIIARLLRPSPDDRFQSPESVLSAIESSPRAAHKSGDGSAPATATADTEPEIRPLSRRAGTQRESGELLLGGLSAEGFTFGDEPPESLHMDQPGEPFLRHASGTDSDIVERPRRSRAWIVLLAVAGLGAFAAYARVGGWWLAHGADGDRDAGSRLTGVDAGQDAPEGLHPTLEGRDGANLQLIAGGDFTMGDPNQSQATPHAVRLTPFYVDAHPVTQSAWRACVAQRGCDAAAVRSDLDGCPPPEYHDSQDDLPLTCVTWAGAQRYCSAFGRRLPTEAEWERVAAGPEGETVQWGPSEWVADWYSDDYYAVSPPIDPSGPLFGFERVVRGGAAEQGEPAGASARQSLEPSAQLADLGFRCARNP